jgi:hypothetical protein
MSTSANSSVPVDANRPLRSLSACSVISLVLFALAIIVLLLAFVFVPRRAVGPADGAALAFLLFVSLTAEFACTVLGVITGWVGIRRSRDYPELPWAGLALNSALLLLQIILPIVLVPGSEAGAGWVVVPMIIIVGAVFAALVGAREFVGRAKRMNDPVPSGGRPWLEWFLGVACGTAVTIWILRLTHPV